jgi:hypothetical protein
MDCGLDDACIGVFDPFTGAYFWREQTPSCSVEINTILMLSSSLSRKRPWMREIAWFLVNHAVLATTGVKRLIEMKFKSNQWVWEAFRCSSSSVRVGRDTISPLSCPPQAPHRSANPYHPHNDDLDIFSSEHPCFWEYPRAGDFWKSKDLYDSANCS